MMLLEYRVFGIRIASQHLCLSGFRIRIIDDNVHVEKLRTGTGTGGQSAGRTVRSPRTARASVVGGRPPRRGRVGNRRTDGRAEKATKIILYRIKRKEKKIKRRRKTRTEPISVGERAHARVRTACVPECV